MPDQYRVTFVAFANNTDSEIACANLAAKLNTSEEKITTFVNGKPLFAACNKEKALKQVKLLANLGIESKIISTAANQQLTASETSQKRDKRIFDALDYITSSLIRLEEKLDELEQRLPQQSDHTSDKEPEPWQDDDLLIDEELTAPVEKSSNRLLIALITGVIILFIVLGLDLAYPALFTFN